MSNMKKQLILAMSIILIVMCIAAFAVSYVVYVYNPAHKNSEVITEPEVEKTEITAEEESEEDISGIKVKKVTKVKKNDSEDNKKQDFSSVTVRKE